MKRIALSLLAVLALGAPAKAIVGGPWDNNLFYSPTLKGTFQGTLTAKNMSAIMIFTIGENSSSEGDSSAVLFPNAGRMVTFYEGATTISRVEAVPDGDTRKIAAVISLGSNSSFLGVTGFMNAKFDNIYPSITYKGKADLFIFSSLGQAEYEAHLTARARGIKTSNKNTANWVWSH